MGAWIESVPEGIPAGQDFEKDRWIPGLYDDVELVVSDFLGPGSPDTVEITAASREEFSEIKIVAASDLILLLESDQVRSERDKNKLIDQLASAVRKIQKGEIDKAIQKLVKAITRTDGCVLRASPDTNNKPHKLDWITDCDAQVEIYNNLIAALNALTPS